MRLIKKLACFTLTAALGGSSVRHLPLLSQDRSTAASSEFKFHPDRGCIDEAGAPGHNPGSQSECGDLHGANLQRTDLHGKSLAGANLNGADLSRANLRKVGLNRADLRDARLDETDLQEADLSNASLNGARLLRANLRKTNLSSVIPICAKPY
ncbi:MAG: hypothetical protein DMG05_18275 [Acidobacteria bacterium]|nr:MAG: hypothetical protein DMG05_18275 [Acidobacteriota bacterium]